MVAAASSSNFKKRKIAPTPAAVLSNGTTGAPPPSSTTITMKKKSPLYNQPQNHYAPPTITTMTKDQLSAWRKEQRRKRNRESAAASRTKTRARIEELEGEVEVWRQRCGDLKGRMAGMERHLVFLTGEIQKRQQLQAQQSQQQVQGRAMTSTQVTANRVVSQPNSPPRGMSPALASENDHPAESNVPFLPPLVAGSASAQIQVRVGSQIIPQLTLSNPNANAPFFVPISSPKVHAPKNKQHKILPNAQEKKSKVSSSFNNNNNNSTIIVQGQGSFGLEDKESNFKRMQHIIPISRQAVKITGARILKEKDSSSSSSSVSTLGNDPVVVDVVVADTTPSSSSQGQKVLSDSVGLSARDSLEGEMVEKIGSSGASVADVGVEVDPMGMASAINRVGQDGTRADSQDGMSDDQDILANDFGLFNHAMEGTNGDDFLDVLMDTFDGEFDPSLGDEFDPNLLI